MEELKKFSFGSFGKIKDKYYLDCEAKWGKQNSSVLKQLGKYEGKTKMWIFKDDQILGLLEDNDRFEGVKIYNAMEELAKYKSEDLVDVLYSKDDKLEIRIIYGMKDEVDECIEEKYEGFVVRQYCDSRYKSVVVQLFI